MKDLGHAAKEVTAGELFDMSGDGVRCELVRGEVREMAPAGGHHGFVANKVGYLLTDFVVPRKLGKVFAAETGFLIARDPDTVRAPDCAFVREERLPGRAPKGYVPVAPDLVVETVSPGDRPREVAEKVRDWLDAGVRLVWEIDPDSRAVKTHRSEGPPCQLRDGDVLEGEGVLAGLRIAVAELWE